MLMEPSRVALLRDDQRGSPKVQVTVIVFRLARGVTETREHIETLTGRTRKDIMRECLRNLQVTFEVLEHVSKGLDAIHGRLRIAAPNENLLRGHIDPIFFQN